MRLLISNPTFNILLVYFFIMGENQIPAFFDEVWNNWDSGKGPCFECPNRDSQCRFYPKFGKGVLNGELAFVAETPNEAGRENQNSPKSRKNRNGEFKSKVRNNPVPTWIRKGNRFSDSFFEDISADFLGDKKRGIYYTNIKNVGILTLNVQNGRIRRQNSTASNI